MYLRKSRADMEAEARGEGETLERHRRALYALAARMEIGIDAEYCEIVSGDTIHDRPEMQRLLSDVSGGRWEGVLVMEVQRLARGATRDQGIVAEAFKYSNTKILTPIKTYDPSDDADEEYFEFELFMSRREYKAINRRMQAGRLASAMEGCYMGSRDPFGYRRVKLKGRKGWSLEIVPEQAEIVRMVFELYTHSSIGSNRIAEKLNHMGVPTYMGGAWDSSGVRQMLRNPLYAGKVQWLQHETVKRIAEGVPVKKRVKTGKHRVIDGLHAPIIDAQIWADTAAKFATHAKRPLRNDTALNNPLAGILRCSICGRAMTMKYRSPAQPIRYQCSRNGCPTTSIEAQTVIDAVLDTLASWPQQYAIADSPAPSAKDSVSETIKAATTAKVHQLLAQKSRLHDLLEQSVYSIEEYTARMGEIKARLEAAQQELSAAQTITPSREELVRRAIPHLLPVLAAYDPDGSPERNNALLRSVIDRIEYSKTVRCTRADNPSEHLTLEIFPRFFDN